MPRGDGGERAAADAWGSCGGGGGVDAGGVDGAGEFGEAVGVVREEVDVDVEGDEEGEVFRREDVFEEADGGLLFDGKDALLAAAGVEQEADGEREVFLLGEGFDGLRLVVVEDVAVGGGEVEDVAVGVADGEVGVDEAGGEVEGGGWKSGAGAAVEAGGGASGEGASWAWRVAVARSAARTRVGGARRMVVLGSQVVLRGRRELNAGRRVRWMGGCPP